VSEWGRNEHTNRIITNTNKKR